MEVGTVCKNDVDTVLILIIMEDTHGVVIIFLTMKVEFSLNPYYNGRYSWSLQKVYNPYTKTVS